MSSVEHLQELHGLPAFDFPAAGEDGELPDAGRRGLAAGRRPVRRRRRGASTSCGRRFLATVDPAGVRALSSASGARRMTRTPASIRHGTCWPARASG